MTDKEIPILKKDGEIAITSAYSDEIIYAVKKGDKLIMKKVKAKEE